MSIIYSEVKNPHNCKPGPFHSKNGLIRVSIDPATVDKFPIDFKNLSCVLSGNIVDWSDRIQNFKVRSDDIWIIGFLKTGTTWMHNITVKLKNNLDFNTDFVSPNFQFFEGPCFYDKIDANGNEEFADMSDELAKCMDVLDSLPSPRLIKSHLPAFLLPLNIWTVKPKMIYLSRDVKDVAMSMYHMVRNTVAAYEGSLSDFCHAFYNDYVMPGPFYQHIKSYHQLQHLDHLLFMTYEEMSADTIGCVKRISEFFGNSYSDEQLQQLIKHVSFAKMREKIEYGRNPEYKFCRKGKVGGYRDEMSEEDIKRFDEWTAKQKKKLQL